MRRCDNCGKELPIGSDFVEVRTFGFNYKGGDFCRPLCFEEYYSKREYQLEPILVKRKKLKAAAKKEDSTG